MQQVQHVAQLRAGDEGPAAAALHALQQLEELAAVVGQAAAEGPVLDGAVQLLQLPQQGQQGLGMTLELCGELFEAGQLAAELGLLRRSQAHEPPCLMGAPLTRIQVVESHYTVSGNRVLHR